MASGKKTGLMTSSCACTPLPPRHQSSSVSQPPSPLLDDVIYGRPLFEEIFVVPDLTKLQQEEDKKLRDKLKEIRESGRKQAKIEKGEIVEEVEGKKEVLFSLKN